MFNADLSQSRAGGAGWDVLMAISAHQDVSKVTDKMRSLVSD